jgi:hypothetical protein
MIKFKHTYLILSFLLSFSLLILTGCDNDNTEVTPSNTVKVLSGFEVSYDNETYAVSFNYSTEGVLESFSDIADPNNVSPFTFDQDGRLTEVSGEGFRDEYNFDVNGNLIEILEYSDNNQDGVLGLYNKYLFEYNASNQVVREDEIYYYEEATPSLWSYFTLYQYSNSDTKKPISSEYYSEKDNDGGTLESNRTYTFDDKDSPFHKTGLGYLFDANDFTARFATNNLENANTTVNGVEENHISANNEYDADGDLIKSTYTISWVGEPDYIFSMSYSYKEI